MEEEGDLRAWATSEREGVVSLDLEDFWWREAAARRLRRTSSLDWSLTFMLRFRGGGWSGEGGCWAAVRERVWRAGLSSDFSASPSPSEDATVLEEVLLSTDVERLDADLCAGRDFFSSDSGAELNPTACAVDLRRRRASRFLKLRRGSIAEKCPCSS